MQKIAVVGVYQTKFGELWDKSLADLASEAIWGCLKDGGVEVKNIQSVFVGNMLAGLSDNQQHLTALISQILGVNIPVVRVEAACASGGMAVRTAIQAIKSGEIDTALVLGVEKMTDLDNKQISQAIMSAAAEEENLAGLTFPGLYALMAKAYCQRFGAKEIDLAQIPVKNHYHAKFNPQAQYHFDVSVDQVLSSPQVSQPLKMLDCSPISDGAAAIFLATPNWVKKHRSRNGVYISGSAHASDSLALSARSELTSLSATKQAASVAYDQAGIESFDASCVEVHDCFSIAEILALEDLGFYSPGEAFHYLQEQEIWLGGKRPINTSGGLKACGHPLGATGVKQIVEATQQLRHNAQDRQVKDAKVAITHNVGGTGGTAVVHVLER